MLKYIGYTDQGNSGGPIVDIDGNIIGIVSFALRRGVAYLFYGTSSDAVVTFLRQAGIPFQPASRQLAAEEVAVSPNAFWSGFAGSVAGGILSDIIIVAVAAGIGAYVAARRR